jgi:signal transduction histidine kinase
MVAALAARDKRLIQSERLAAIGRMAAHVTHEVRNPLSSIGLNVEMLEEELANAGAETKDLLSAIHKEIEHLRGVTEEYLRLARVPNPQLEPEYLGELASSTAQFLRPELSAGGVDLELDVAETLPLVAMDEAQIRQVLLNLLKNAREAMPDGGKVRLSVRAADDGVVVRVEDDGAGMEPEQRERIFDLFYTTKKLGTGLGLPLSQQIVLAHGGYITCESVPGNGTMFELWFPVADSTGPVKLAKSG